MQLSHVGVSLDGRLHCHKRVYSQRPIRHHPSLAVHALSTRTSYRQHTRRAQLHVAAASSTDQDVRQQSEVARSAQDLAQGVQDFLDESQKAFSSDEPALPEHPIGEEGTLDVADGIDASVRVDWQMLHCL